MELRQLAHFVAIVEHGSLGRAARVLNVTEPALSKSLRRLEESLGVRLLDRGTRGMTPTLFGDTLLTHARLILGEMDASRRVIDELRGVSRGVVRVGVRPAFGSTVLPRAIARLQERRPNVRAVVREGFTPNLIAEVIRGSLDFVVAARVEGDDPNLLQEPFADSPIGIVARAGHPLAGRPRLAPADLASAKWILPLRTDPIREILGQVLRRNGLDAVDVVAESNSVAFTTSYIRRTDAVGYFPRAMIEYGAAGGGLVLLDVAELEWRQQLNIIRRRHVSLYPAAQLLIQEMKTVSAGLAAG